MPPLPSEFVSYCNSCIYDDKYENDELQGGIAYWGDGPWKGRKWDMDQTRVVGSITLEKGRSTAIARIDLAGHNRNIIMDFKDSGLSGRTEVVLGFLNSKHKSSTLILKGWDALSMDFFLRGTSKRHLPKEAWRIYFEDSNGNLVNSVPEYHYDRNVFRMRPARDLWAPVPEPAAYGAVLGAVGLGLGLWRRRRRAVSAPTKLTAA